MSALWLLDPDVAYLNHGSFGACPRPVLEHQSALRARMEAEPIQFFANLEETADLVRSVLGQFVGADPDDLAFVVNATTGVNTVLRSLDFEPGDEILITDHTYNACRNAAVAVAERSGARVITARVPFPIGSPDEVVEAIVSAVTARTRLLLVDHVTSPTALVFPVERLVAEMSGRGIDTLIDGAHAPGMVPVDVEAIGAAYYTANAHKWLCAPKGAAFLHVRRDRQAGIVPTVISHGANSPRIDRSRFRLLFDWTGTNDPTAHLVIPTAINTMAAQVPGGWPALTRRNHAMALAARDLLIDALQIDRPAPDEMVGAMAAVPLPPAAGDPRVFGPTALQQRLWQDHHVEVPINVWPQWPQQLLRVSAQIYNRIEQYAGLAHLLARDLLHQKDPG
ncbi:MAG: aminotransferase class V-fold PLP-dependent enzyme [Acidimicrobiia bacterium]|nr:aminotransferase class V-fold PLP-dependent enzyme [Acidimicrobiia bacterium]